MPFVEPLAVQGGVESDWIDQTLGAAIWGAADVGQMVGSYLGSWKDGPDIFDSMASGLARFKAEHPQYAPMEVNSALELITNPKAMVGRVSAGLVQMGATIGALSLGGAVALPLAIGLNYMVENRRAYEKAVADGFTDDQAITKGYIVGTINTLLNIIPAERLFRARDGWTSITSALVDKAYYAAKGLGAVGEAAKFVAAQTVFGTLSGATDDLVSLGLYGKPLPENFMDQMAQQLIMSGVNAELMGFAAKETVISKAGGRAAIKQKMEDAPSKIADIYTPSDLYNVALKVSGGDLKYADYVTAMTNSWADTYGKRHNLSREEVYAQKFAKDPGGNLVGETLYQEPGEVGKMFSLLRRRVDDLTQDKWVGRELLAYLKRPTKNARAIVDEELEWTGVGGLLMSKDKVTKEEVQGWLRDHEVKIVTLYKGDQVAQEYANRLDEMLNARTQLEKQAVVAAQKIKTPQDQAQVEALWQQIGQIDQQVGKTRDELFSAKPRHDSYSLPGPKEGYTEVLMRFPQYIEEYTPNTNSNAFYRTDSPESRARWEERVKQGTASKSLTEKTLFSEPNHWDEPNVIVHLRYDVRDTSLGKTVFLEEIQSDWHQKGREKGYKTEEDTAAKARYQELLQKDQVGRLSEAESRELSDLNRKLSEKIEPAPFRNSWQELGLKRLLLDTIEKGYDRIAWTSGQHQIDRYGALDAKQQEGMKSFYDKILPQKMLELVRRYDKRTKIDVTELKGELQNPVTAPDGSKYSDRRDITSVLSINVSPDAKARIAQEGITLFQSNKGSTTFLKTGQAIIRAFENADSSTLIHELGHVFRRTVEGGDKDVLEAWAGVKDGMWERGHEEKFARAWERYVREGVTPNGELVDAFRYLKKQLRKVYGTLKVLGRDSALNDDVRAVMDRILVEDTSPITAKRLELQEVNRRLNLLKAGIDPDEVAKKAAQPTPDDSTNLGVSMEKKEGGDVVQKGVEKATRDARIAQEKERAKTLREELKQLKLENLKPGVPSEAERLYEFHRELAYEAETPQTTKLRGLWESFLSPIRAWTYNESSVLSKTKAGRIFVRQADDAIARAKQWAGPFNQRLQEVITALTPEEKAWLRSEEGHPGFTNLQYIIDPTGAPRNVKIVADTPGKQNVVALARELFDKSTQWETSMKVMRRLKGKRWEPMRPSTDLHTPRAITEEFYEMILKGGGPNYQAVLDYIQQFNPRMDIKKLGDQIREHYTKPAMNRILGAVDETRDIPILPAVAHLPNGRTVSLLRTDPQEVLGHAINRQSQRLAWIEKFGQGVLESVKPRQIIRLVEILGIDPVKTGLQYRVDDKGKVSYTGKISDSVLEDRLIDAGVTITGLSGGRKEMEALAKLYDVSVHPSRADLLPLLEGVQYDPAVARRLVSYARKIEGVLTSEGTRKRVMGSGAVRRENIINLPRLFQDTLQRVREEVPISAARRLVELYKKEGGKEDDLLHLMQIAQGVPVYRMSTSGFWGKAIKLGSTALSVAQTSGAVAPNIPQVLVQLPQLGGLVKLSEAVHEAMTNFKENRAQLVSLGAVMPSLYSWLREPGRGTEWLAKVMSQGASVVTGQRAVAEMNNVIAGTVGRKLAEHWRSSGMGKGDESVARFLRLNDKELSQIRSGQMTDLTYAKIVQNMVAGTQFMTEHPLHRSKMENIPLVKILFAYSSYALGTMRANWSVARDVAAVMKGDVSLLPSAMRRSAMLIAGTWGAGTLSLVLREAIKGNFRQEREEWDINKAWKTISEAALLGPVHRMLDAFNYSNNIAEKAIIGTMPQLSAMIDMFKVMMGKGRYGEFILGKRALEATKENTPLLRGILTWLDHSAWPEQIGYMHSRGLTQKWIREQGLAGAGGSGEEPINPLYHRVSEMVKRYDFEGAIEAMRESFLEAVNKGIDPDKFFRGLRLSLSNRSPVHLRDDLQIKYLIGLDEATRREVLFNQARYMGIVNAIVPVRS